MVTGKGRGSCDQEDDEGAAGERERSRSPAKVTADPRKGARVRLVGLKGAAHLNGMAGVCGDWDNAAGRWIVSLENGEQKSIKPENLTVEDAEEEMDDNENENENMRMAKDEESGFVSCCSYDAAKQAIASNETRIEFGGLTDADERSKCVDLVVEALSGTSRQLLGIAFVGCALTAAQIQCLASALRSGFGPKVSAFGVMRNPGVDDDAWRDLFEALPPKAMWLDFGDNKLSDDAMAPLIDRLEGREELDKLYLDGNCLRSIEKLCTALPDTGVTQLDLGDNEIDDAGVKLIARALNETVITILVIGSNPITADGVKSIFAVLSRSSLDALYLDNTGADDDCLLDLGGALKDAKLTELHLDSTKISDAGVRGLIPHLAASELTYLDISGNNVSEETTKLLETTMSLERGYDQAAEDEQEGEEDA